MSKDLAFVFSKADIEGLLTRDVIYFPLTTVAKKFLIEQEKAYLLIESFFPTGAKREIFDLSEKLSFRFTRLKIRNLSALSFSLNNFLAKKMFYLACIDTIFKKFQPKKIYVGREEAGFKSRLVSSFDEYSPLIVTVARKYGASVSGASKTSWLLKYAIQFAILPKVRSNFIPSISKKVIILAANTYHVENCLSLILAILKDKQLEPLVIGKLGNLKSALASNKIHHIDYNGSIDLLNIPRYFFVKLFLTVSAIFYIRREKLGFLDYDLWDLIKNRLISLFLTDLPGLYLHEAFYSKLLKTYDVKKFLYLTNASNIQVYIKQNKAKNIDSYEIQHGITFGAESKYFTGDRMIAWGKIPAEILAEKGISKEKILQGGWPPYINDSNPVKNSALKKNVIKRILFLGQDADGLFLLNTTQMPEVSYERLFEALSKAKFEYKLLIRLHPRADAKLPYLISKKYDSSFDLSKDESLSSAIERSDLIITQTTSAALDSIIMDKPVIYFPSMEWGVKFLDNTNVKAVARTTEELIKLLSDNKIFLISDNLRKRQNKFLADYLNIGQVSMKVLAGIVVGKSSTKN